MASEPVSHGSDAPSPRPADETVTLTGAGMPPGPDGEPTLVVRATPPAPPLLRGGRGGASPDHPRKLGPYTLVRLLGRGGMGAVWEALDTRLNRRVAVKVLVAGEHASEQETERFRREAQSSAKLRHPNIVPVHDFGHEAGHCYLVMDLVDGVTLADALRRRQFTYREKALLLEKVARAVQYAHEQGVVHRDLKPSNIMLEFAKGGSSSGEAKPGTSTNVALPVNERALGEPLVMDFGLAKDIARDSSLSQSGQAMGTPAYMPPEQAEGRGRDVGPRSDVYSLGAILYEMLTGRVPFTGENALQVLRATLMDEPVWPRQIAPRVPRDLETVCLKCLEKAPVKRCQSAQELAEELGRWLRDEPIVARPSGTWERGLKWARRRPASAALIAVSVLALAGLIGGGAWYNTRLSASLEETRKAGGQKERERHKAVENLRQAQERLAESLVSQGDALCLGGRIVEAKARYEDARRLLDQLGESTLPAETGTFEANAQAGVPLQTFAGHAGWVSSVAFSPDGKLALSGSWDKTLKLWDMATGRELRTFKGHAMEVYSVAFSPDGKLALSASLDQALKLWEVATGLEVRTFRGHGEGVWSVAFSPDGKLALSGSRDGTLKLWDLSTGQELRTFSGHAGHVRSVAFSPDGNLVLSGSADKTLKLWDAATGREVRTFRGHSHELFGVALSPDGKLALSASFDKTMKLWEVATGRELRTFSGHANGVWSVAFSLDGRLALSGSWDNTLKLWDVATGRELRTFSGHADVVTGVAFSADGNLVLSGSDDNTMKLWDVARGSEVPAFKGHAETVTSVAFSPDGRLALSGSQDKTLRLWDAATGLELHTFSGHRDGVRSVAFSPDGKLALSGSSDRTIRCWDVAAGRELRNLAGHADTVWSVAFSPDGKLALSGSEDKTLKLWDLSTWRELRAFSGHAHTVTSVVFSPDGKLALSGSLDKSLKLWDVATGREVRTFSGQPGMVGSVAFSPGGKLALSGNWLKTMKLWDAGTGQELHTFSGHAGEVNGVAFSPDEKLALSGSYDMTLKLWDVVTGREVHTFRGHADSVTSVAFSPDGNLVLSGSADKTAQFRDLTRSARYREFEASLPKAREAVQKNENDAEALKTFGEWYAFRGVNGWAVDFLEKARKNGANVPPLTLARCYWLLSVDKHAPLDKLTDHRAAAVLEFQKELARVKAQPAPQDPKAMAAREQEELYLNLCLKAAQSAPREEALSADSATNLKSKIENP